MKLRLKIAFIILLVAPLMALAWLGIRTAGDEQEIVRLRFEELVSSRLKDVDQMIVRLLNRHQKEFYKLLDVEGFDAESFRNIVRENRMVSQIFVLDEDGALRHPPQKESRNHLEEQFINRTERIWETRESFLRPEESSRRSSSPIKQTSQTVSLGQTGEKDWGWYVWYWGSGINLIYWRQQSGREVAGIEIDRAALFADIIGELPTTQESEGGLEDGCIRLTDANDNAVYTFGLCEPGNGEKPSVTRSLSQPLSSWRLKYYASKGYFDNALGGSLLLSMGVGFAALFIVVFGLAWYFFRENSKEMRDAAERITFVNQVSHELKTPLTNIRMYAELLDEQIDESETQLSSYTNVIVEESQRLSRLIANVLSFARKRRHKLVLRPVLGISDQAIEGVIEQFRPGFESKEIAIEFDGGASEKVEVDLDALGQIVGNLLSNVEKYAALGGKVHIKSKLNGGVIEIQVRDWGPGIPKSARDAIFRPFFRASGKLTDGVAGTGIGLSIARDLARLHGGDLTLEESSPGAHFKVTLKTPLGKG